MCSRKLWLATRLGIVVGAMLQVRLHVRPGVGHRIEWLSDTGRSPMIPRNVSATCGRQVQRGWHGPAAGCRPLSARGLICSPVCMHRLAMVTSSPVSLGFLHPGAQCQSDWPSLADRSTKEGEQYDWPTRPRGLW